LEERTIIKEFFDFIDSSRFPCIGAKTVKTKQQLRCMVAGHMTCPADDRNILRFLYQFVDDYRHSDTLFHSAAVIFPHPETRNEEMFETLLWSRLQALADLDAERYSFDERVSRDPASPSFSFSLKEEAFFIVGLHPSSSRQARRFRYPTLVFNPHMQFEKLRESELYEHMKKEIRRRDITLSGSINPMLADFGHASEAFQYSGRQYNSSWQCPLHPKHGKAKHDPAP
jgi:hypothetical protein